MVVEGIRTAPAEQLALEGLIQKVKAYWPSVDEGLLKRAYARAEEAHRGQLRLSGEPYVQHPLATAWILADLRLDPPTIAAALLHDVPEDTAIPLEEVRRKFGEEVTKLVDGVTKLSRVEWDSLEQEEAESLRKMFLAMAEDVRVVLIKLADRLHNMRTLDFLPPERQKKVAEETLEIFAPLANRLGIWQIKWELEDLALRHLDPQKYHEIAALLAETLRSREEFIARVIEILKEGLAQEGIKAEITGRPKPIYSIYRKMQAKGREFEQIYDVRAVRIIVHEVKDCYAALGVVHSLWRPIPGEFDDYIANPKDNLYRSLHTAVVGPEGKPLEIQIRSREMHETAEYGIAAHWRYKEDRRGRADPNLEAKIAWLRQLMAWRQELADAREFVASLKTDLFSEQVYLFTPKGDIVELPSGSTPIDFAYAIHTEIGDHCRGAKVNGRLVSLNYKMQSGDRVEIITAKDTSPSRDWLNSHLGYVATSRARQKIRQWFKRQAREENITHGREILEKELHRLGISEVSFEEIAGLFRYDKVDDFLAAIGYGDLSAQNIATKILEAESEKLEAEEEVVLPEVRPRAPTAPGVRVKGVGDLLIHMARCCSPVPGDQIIGYVTRGQGVTIHRRDCRNILGKKDQERLIEVDWGEDKKVYPVVIRVEAYDRKGLLKDIAEIVAQEDVNISSTSVTTNKKDGKAVIIATLEITGMDQLGRILAKIESLTNVLEAQRQAG